MSVLDGVEFNIARLPKDLQQDALAETARALARSLDSDTSAAQKSMCAKALQDVMRELRELAPPKQERTKLDELTERRQIRLARKADSKG